MKHRGAIIGVVLLVTIAVISLIVVDGAKHTTKNNSGRGYGTETPADVQPDGSSPEKAIATKAVSIKDFMFTPMAIKVKVGDTVTWTNQDSVQHSVKADTPSADAPNSKLFSQGETYEFTFKKAGTYSLHCGSHDYMKATVTVIK